MKGYKIPELEIHRFDSDEILTGSAENVDNWNTDQKLNAQTIDWTNLQKVNTTLGFKY